MTVWRATGTARAGRLDETLCRGFIDAADIADVVVAALLGEGHEGQIHELTGPRLLTVVDAAQEIGRALGREITYTHLEPPAYREHLIAQGVPAPDAAWMAAETAPGDEELTDDVQRVLGRPARDFADYVRDAVARGVWDPASSGDQP